MTSQWHLQHRFKSRPSSQCLKSLIKAAVYATVSSLLKLTHCNIVGVLVKWPLSFFVSLFSAKQSLRSNFFALLSNRLVSVHLHWEVWLQVGSDTALWTSLARLLNRVFFKPALWHFIGARPLRHQLTITGPARRTPGQRCRGSEVHRAVPDPTCRQTSQCRCRDSLES